MPSPSRPSPPRRAERRERAHEQYHHPWGGLEEAFPAHMHAPAKRIDLALGGRNQIAGQSPGMKGFRQSNLNAEKKTQMMLRQQRQEAEERMQEATAGEHNALYKAVLAWKAYVEMVEQRIVSRTPPEDDEEETGAGEYRNAPDEGQQDAGATFEQSLSKELERWSTRERAEPSAPRLYEDIPRIANIASPRSLQQAITISSTPQTTTATSEYKQAQARENAEAPTRAQGDTQLQTPSEQPVVLADVMPSLAEDWGWIGRSGDIARVVREHTHDQPVGRTLESSHALEHESVGDVAARDGSTGERKAAAVSQRWEAEMGTSFTTRDEADTGEIKQLSSTEKEKEDFGSELHFLERHEDDEAPDEGEGQRFIGKAGGSTC